MEYRTLLSVASVGSRIGGEGQLLLAPQPIEFEFRVAFLVDCLAIKVSVSSLVGSEKR